MSEPPREENPVRVGSSGLKSLESVRPRASQDAVKAHKKDVKEWEQRMTSKATTSCRRVDRRFGDVSFSWSPSRE